MPIAQPFEIHSEFKPTGDQPTAINSLVSGLRNGQEALTLLGATGTGKTFTMANVIQQMQRPTLIISHNKTLAAQLFEEMRELFPKNAVSYFVSYYDYYQPEAYIPQRDIYIEKDASRNDDLDRLRLAATSNLLSRDDVIVVSSVSCIYGLGSPEAYGKRMIALSKGQEISRRDFLLGLADMQYARNEIGFERGNFRVRGDVIEVHPAYEQYAIRIELFGDEIDRLEFIDPTSGEVLAEETQVFIFPAVHYVMPEEKMATALAAIREELDERVMQLRHEGKLLEAQRLLAHTRYDLEMMEEVGYCSGVENYAAVLDGRPKGARPYSLLDYFRYVPGHKPDDWLCFIDESHVTVPQIRGMYFGDKARKQTLVDHGFRLPSAMDNRPLKFEEFEEMVPQVIYVSATPSDYELERTGGDIIEQVIRPTGLLDPPVEVLPARGQVPDLLERCRDRTEKKERVLVTALTKRLCEDLTNYLHDNGIRVRYLHSEIDTLERLDILRDLREGEFDVLVGVNLLREGLDLPEVSLVAILDADKTGFLRSETSLIQTMGRAARNVNSEVVMYADTITQQMQDAIDETERRRKIQIAYNKEHNITPVTILKSIRQGIQSELKARRIAKAALGGVGGMGGVKHGAFGGEKELTRDELIAQIEKDMFQAAERLEFEKAARLRDTLNEIKSMPEMTSTKTLAELTKGEKKDKPKPGMPRSKAGITGRKGRKK